MATPTAELRLTARDETQQAINSALAGLQRLQGGVEGLRNLFTSALGGLGLGLGIQEIFRQTMEAERTQARLATVLKTTGYAAGLTAKDIDGLAESLKAASTFDDDDLKAGLASLLRFRDISGDAFRQAAGLATDLAVAMNTDLASAFQTIGRLGQEPTEALKGLKAAGFDLRGEQLELAQALEAAGDKAGAQKIAFEELQRTIGGAAQGEAAGLYGGLKDVQRAYGDLEKQLGRTPFLTSTAAAGFDFLTRSLQKWQQILDQPTFGAKFETYLGRIPQWQRNADQAGASGSWGPTQAEELAAAGRKAREDSKTWDAARADDERIGKWLEEDARKRAAASRSFASEAKRLADEQKRLKDKQLQDDIAVMGRQLDAEEEFQRESAKAWDIYTQNVLDIRRQGIKDEAEWFGVTDLERFRDGSTGTRGWGGNFGTEVKGEADKAADAARELGLTFQSAFEDAVIAGKSFSDVLQGIEKDLLRVAARRLVTEPLVQAGSDLFKGAGAWIGEMFASAGGNVMTGSGPLALQRFAAGGVAHKPTLSLFGEGSKPEAYVPLPDGRSIPVTVSGEAAPSIVQHFHISVTVQHSGEGNPVDAQKISQAIGAEVRRIMVQESRPGGLLKK